MPSPSLSGVLFKPLKRVLSVWCSNKDAGICIAITMMARDQRGASPIMSVTIYHNPGCSKSRRTLELIREKGIEPEIIEYLKDPPDTSTIERLLNLLNLQPRDLMRKNEAEYKNADLDNPKISRNALIESMHRHPILIERPIVVSGDRARIARPRMRSRSSDA